MAVGRHERSVIDLLGVRDDLLEIAPVADLFGSPFRVTEAAVASVGAALAAVATFHAERTGREVLAHLDGRHAAVAFHGERLLRTLRSDALALWDPLAGNYPTADGWIRLHTNLARHRDAVLGVLDVAGERDAVAAAVATWPGGALEDAVTAAGGVAARMRTRDEFVGHPQRAAVLERPLVDLATPPSEGAPTWDPGPGRGLEGVRVLDLSRVIAGPVAARFLAAFGADVVRVDPPLDDAVALEIETGAGKRRTTIDLLEPAGRRKLEELVSGADVLLEAFRPGALAQVGYPDARLRELRPGLVVGHLSAYGERGPWGDRRGFDSVVQVANGLAHACGFDATTGPGRLPAQALDHASGYLMAAGLVAGLVRRLREPSATTVGVSLARTGEWLADLGTRDDPPGESGALAPEAVEDLIDTWSDTAWGPVAQVRPVGRLGDRSAAWTRPASPRTEAALSWVGR